MIREDIYNSHQYSASYWKPVWLFFPSLWGTVPLARRVTLADLLCRQQQRYPHPPAVARRGRLFFTHSRWWITFGVYTHDAFGDAHTLCTHTPRVYLKCRGQHIVKSPLRQKLSASTQCAYIKCYFTLFISRNRFSRILHACPNEDVWVSFFPQRVRCRREPKISSARQSQHLFTCPL